MLSAEEILQLTTIFGCEIKRYDSVDFVMWTVTNKKTKASGELYLGDVEHLTMDKVLEEIKRYAREAAMYASESNYLSMWNCKTGAPTTLPNQFPYSYKNGDYYIVDREGCMIPRSSYLFSKDDIDTCSISAIPVTEGSKLVFSEGEWVVHSYA